MRLLQCASLKREEVKKLEAEAQWLETKGWGEIKGGHHGIWGRRFLWTLEGSHLAFLPSSFTTSTILCLPEPQFPSSPAVSSRVCRTWSLRSCRPCHCVCPSSCYSSFLRATYWQICNPSEFNWGAPKESISAGLRAAKRAHQPHGQPFVLSWGRCISEWGWCACFAVNLFSMQTSLGITKNALIGIFL